MKNFDLYWVPFRYDDSSECKYRPALVINNQIVRLSKITSNLNCIETPYHVIKDWKAAGLTKPSLIRLTKTADVDEHMLGKYIGHLAPEDEKAVKAALGDDTLTESDLKFFEIFTTLNSGG